MAVINGTNRADNITGTDDADTISGFDGADTLSGADGADRILGGRGNDPLLNGNDGDDSVFGGAGDDTLLFSPGVDRLNGGDGSDTVDPFFSEARVLNVDLQAGTATYTLNIGDDRGDGRASLVGIENVPGSLSDDRILGNNAANLLTGDLGNDTLNGRGGDDRLLGGFGSERFTLEPGDDFIDGGGDIDTIDFSGAGTFLRNNVGGFTDEGVTVTRFALGGSQNRYDTVTGVERIIGTDFGDELYFGGGIQTNESALFGRGGDDELFAGAGGKAFGGTGDDVLTGGGPGLSLQGDAGADRFSTGLSQGGNDTFATINDFQRGTDELQLELGLGRGRSEFAFLDSNDDDILNASDAAVDSSFAFVDGQRRPALEISTSSQGELEQEAIFDLKLAGISQLNANDFFV